jgi:hypothetical protein
MPNKSRRKSFALTKLSLSVAVALGALASAPASAFVVLDSDAGQLRLDTTVRYNLGWRMKDINPDFANMYSNDETEAVFKKHDLITNRLDVLMESDYIGKYENGLNYGARVSGAAWDEMAYPGHPRASDQMNAFAPTMDSNYGPGRQWSNYAKRYVVGSSGELLDAFIFSGFEIGGTNLNVKLGKHTIAWGEANFNAGVNVDQAPVDAIKGQSNPGSQTKEIFRPINQLSANWALNTEWSILGDYQLEWKPVHSVSGGTFFGPADGAGNLFGSDPACAATLPGLCILNLDAVTPNKNGGSWGLATRWSPSWWDGSMGLYYRKFDEMTPWASMQNQAGLPGIRLSFARGTELYGASITHNMFGFLNTALEVVYRKNTALNSITFNEGSQGGAAPVVFANLGVTPDYSQVEGARGNTIHVIANAISLLDKTFWYETGTAVFELGYQRLDKVTKNKEFFNSVGYACSASGLTPTLDKGDGCSTKDSLAGNILFSPQWTAVAPSLDVAMPMSATYDFFGNTPVNGGNSNYGAYSWSIGLNGTYKNTYEVGLLYAAAHHNYKTAPGNGTQGIPGAQAMSTSNGPQAILNSHNWLGLHFKTSF